ncbi:nuclear transport factor 2 family protein [Phytomonospora endophytica]|uniref:Ketosteroid isomerase-like protein n=1 Tax=Phytomonospora endophytica TaxID=714109 RepID=A0A841G4U7_9ACTN|nr:nuclear transport factor 2 family protein [Phytomonospora endophytica]MBB6039130.1 ketosteroid isomerase-like protein [Phytomonospora endophytica]GIG67633.1 hypothetical protein Pen01_39280 [Phytomonospora endophytica]
MSATDTVRAMFAAYRAQDRAAAEALIGEDFHFTSPRDERIDRAAFFARCFPTADRFTRQDLLQVVPGEGEDVFTLYEYDLADGGGTFRNTEVSTVRDGLVVETQVFFGGAVTGS